MSCTEQCWRPVPCPVCGCQLPPRGRSVADAMQLSACCDEHRNRTVNPRHLWNSHDDCRHYTDPDGWAAHVAACNVCGMGTDAEAAHQRIKEEQS